MAKRNTNTMRTVIYDLPPDDFDQALAALTPEEFVTKMLHERVGPAGVVTGEDFTFAKDKAGSTARLAEIGAPLGIATQAVGAVSTPDGQPVSSSRIRAALQVGDCALATQLLTRPFAIEGIVQHGDKVGRTIGYPTANIDMGKYLRPAYGIYAVRGLLPDGRVLDGAANLGIRPTFDPPKELLEPYFLDFAEDLYDQCIEVQLIERLRANN